MPKYKVKSKRLNKAPNKKGLIDLAERSVKEELLKDVEWMPFDQLIQKVITKTPLKAQIEGNEELLAMYQELLERYGKAPSMQALMVVTLAQKAMHGDVAAFKEVVDRIEGKAIQRNENKNMNVSYEDYLKSLEKETMIVEGDDGDEEIE